MSGSDYIHPNQLKLLMTPGEIKDQYQPLDADRAHRQGPISRGGESTYRARRTDMGYNDAIPDAAADSPGYRRRMKDFRAEPVADTWARKGREAAESGVTDSVRNIGVVRPVTLGNITGLEGKPQVTGGHHRIQAAEDAGNEQYLPVVHHEGLVEGAIAALKQMGLDYH
jgi:hypothetical protein